MKRPPWYKRIWNWILRLLLEEYELTIWYVHETTETEHGLKTVQRKSQVYMLKEIDKKTNTHIVGREVDGSKFEIKTVQPFDYQIRKLK